MSLTLNVDGAVTDTPSDADIAHAFQSLDKGTGFLTGPGISIIVLQRAEAHLLTATGTHAAGFMLSYQDGDLQYEHITNPEHALSVDETIRAFQSYARGKDWGQSMFQWERNELFVESSKAFKRILVILSLGCLAWLLLRYFSAH